MLLCNICTELQKVFKYTCLAKMQHIYTRTQRISSLCTLLLIRGYLPCVRHVTLCKKIKGIFVSVPTDIKMSQELSNIMKQSACSSCTQYGLQRFNHGLNSGNVQYSDQLHRIA